MSQEFPSPTLVSLEPGDKFLYAQWKNNPYIDIYNAYLLVVNTTDFHDIKYIYLTEEEALDEAMKIDSLDNGTVYAVQYTQTQNTPDGVQGNSNTILEAPIATPIAPTILNNLENPITVNSQDDHFVISLPVKYSFNNEPMIEETMFKIIYQDNDGVIDISTQTFEINKLIDKPDGNVIFHELDNIYEGKYAISCFNVNVNGVGPLSNVIDLQIGSKPFKTNVTKVVSGLDSKLDVYVSTPQNEIVGFDITQINIYYAIPSDSDLSWTKGGSLNNLTIDNGIITANGFVTDLTNGTKYLIKAVAVNIDGEGPSGIEGKGVPAKQSTVSNVAITKVVASGGIVEASWTKIDGTFGPTSYNYKLLDGNTILKQDTVTDASISLANLVITSGNQLKLSITPADTVTNEYLSHWNTPSLNNVSNNWIGQTVTSDLYTINDKPLPLTSLVCSGVGNGSLTFTYVKPTSIPANAPTKYTIQLSTSSGFEVENIVQTVDITDLSLSSKVITNLTNDVSYYAKIFASNNYGTSEVKTIGPYYPLLDINTITGLIGPVQNYQPISAQYPELYTLGIDWDVFNQSGYTLVNYKVNVYKDDKGTITLVSSENNSASFYAFNGTLGTTYYFGIIVNATINQLNTSVSSAETKTNSILVAGAPYIDPKSVSFETIQDDKGNEKGKITFTVDDRYSPLKGLFSLVLPSSESSSDAEGNIFQTQPEYYPLSDVPVGNKTYSAVLTYKIPEDPAYVIYAVNSIGVNYISDGLIVKPSS